MNEAQLAAFFVKINPIIAVNNDTFLALMIGIEMSMYIFLVATHFFDNDMVDLTLTIAKPYSVKTEVNYHFGSKVE